MLTKIIYKNFRSNFKNYVAFFIGNMMGVTEFFVFWGLYSIVKNMSANSVMLEDTLEEIIISVSVITIFSTALMVYSMLNYIKKRIADYSLFYILGMKKQKLYVFVFSEYLAGWMVSLLIGLGIGRGILYLIQQIWHKLFPTYISLCSVGTEIYFNTCKISFFIMLAVVFVLLIWADNSGISRMIAGNEIKEKMGSYINKLKKYVDPSSNHPLPNHDTDHLYKIRETVTGNLFGYYKMNDEAENVVVFSNKYFSRQYKILSKKEYEPNTLTLFAFPNESKEKATAKIKKYAKIHGPNDFELTDTPQSTLYITDEFLKTVKKGDIFKITNKIFIIIALLISSIFVSAIKAASDLQYYRKEKEFLQCMGIHEKIWKKIFDVEIQILSWISLITATILSAAYMIMNIHIESERGVIYGYKIWIYWLVILCLYWFMHYILQRIVTRYARKNVERQEKRK